jgi:hypothetical protein
MAGIVVQYIVGALCAKVCPGLVEELWCISVRTDYLQKIWLERMLRVVDIQLMYPFLLQPSHSRGSETRSA